MSNEQRAPEQLLPLTPAVLQILLALADGERHGYSIMQEIAIQTQGTLKVGPTTLYRSIKHMLAAELISETEERPDPDLDDERRRYYRLTDFGRQVAVAEIKRLEHSVVLARSKHLLGGLQANTVEGA